MQDKLKWQPVLSKKHIKRIRKTLGESQSVFAKRLSVDTVTVARWETGQRKCSGQNATVIARLDNSGNPLVKEFIVSNSSFSNYTDNALKAILLAQAETHRQGWQQINTEQILSGLIGEGSGMASDCLRRNGATFGLAEVSVELRNGTGPCTIFKEKSLSDRTRAMLALPRQQTYFHILNFGTEYSAGAKALFDLAAQKSEQLGRKTIGTGHILLGLLELKNSGGLKILESMGINCSLLKEDLLSKLSSNSEETDDQNNLDALASVASSSHQQPAIAQPLAKALDALREAVEMSFLTQDYDFAMMLREQELQIRKGVSARIRLGTSVELSDGKEAE